MTSQRPTSDTPSALWLAMVALVKDRPRTGLDAAYEGIGMPFSRFRALRRLEERDLTQRELAAWMRVDAAAVTGIVGDLVDRGLVSRSAHPTDGRVKVVSINAAGRAAMERARNSPEIAPASFGALSAAERRTLADLLAKLREES